MSCLVHFSSLVEHIKLMIVGVVELSRAVQPSGGKGHKKGTGESVFGPHRRERIAFLHVLHKA